MSKNTRLSNRRIELNMTQQQVADKSGVLLSTYQKLESGANNIENARLCIAINIAKALNWTAEQLLHDIQLSSKPSYFVTNLVTVHSNIPNGQDVDYIVLTPKPLSISEKAEISKMTTDKFIEFITKNEWFAYRQ